MGGIGEVLLGLIALFFLLLIAVVALALPIFAIWWVCKCIIFFVKVPNQLDEIIASLNTIKKQLASANKSLQDASKTKDASEPQSENTPKTSGDPNLDSLQES